MSAELTAIVADDSKLGEGSWVWGQGVAAEHGFRNVSKSWYDKTMSFEDGLEHLENERRERHDFDVERKNLAFNVNDDGQFVVQIDGAEYVPTEHAARQLANWMKMPQTVFFYFMNGPNAQYKDMLCDALEVARDTFKSEDADGDDEKVLKFRTYTDGTLRAVLSKSYSIVDNRWYLELLQELIPGGRLSHFRFSDADTVYGNILIPDSIRQESDSEYGGMLSIGNSEIGLRRIEQIPSIFRAICMNGCIWGQTEGTAYHKRHRGIVLEELRKAISDNLLKQIPLLNTGVDKLLETRAFKVETYMANLFAAIIKEHNWDKDVANTAMGEFENQGSNKTAFGVVDAMTRAGQEHEPRLWLATDEIAGRIVGGGSREWERLNSVGKNLTAKQVATYLGV